eukprot:6177782-Pleurochrysis_carterae.AAC.3
MSRATRTSRTSRVSALMTASEATAPSGLTVDSWLEQKLESVLYVCEHACALSHGACADVASCGGARRRVRSA